jgi:hypothetical protein
MLRVCACLSRQYVVRMTVIESEVKYALKTRELPAGQTDKQPDSKTNELLY